MGAGQVSDDARRQTPGAGNPRGEGAERLRVEVRGAVQGVGFRPFVYRLATTHGLAGWVLNDAHGVFLEVEGRRAALEAFLAALRVGPPAPARIHTLAEEWLPPIGHAGFEIRRSEPGGEPTAVLLPDLASCADCLAEVRDPDDRRHRYPFANCTHCGPRFTIIRALPYDRPNTTMAGFDMCSACRAEYDDPMNRRFHAQPIACPVCGPRLTLLDRDGAELAAEDLGLVRAAADLRAGLVVAVKGLGGFQLMCDAAATGPIARLRAGKPRRDKPFAIMVRDLEQARSLCEVSAAAARILASPETPIVLLPRRAGAPVADEVAPGLPTLGVMLPATPLHQLLLDEVGRPVVATSGNRSDEPIAIDVEECRARLGGVADRYLTHDRPIERHADDSVGVFIGDAFTLLRRARGYAPLPLLLTHEVPALLAVGAHLKNTVALASGRQVFVSQHLGDLESPEAAQAFERVIRDFLRLYSARPVAVAHDLHPDYVSTQWARSAAASAWDPRTSPPALVAVQHHHAHLAACLAEHDEPGPALGVIWDGTGYGLDESVWGGEFLLGDASRFARVASLRPFRLPGGEAAVREPRRVAVSLLYELLGARVIEGTDFAVVASFSAAERALLARMLATGTRAPVTTSAGRLFDGLAALLGLDWIARYEAQAAIHLEAIATGVEAHAYPFPLVEREAAASREPHAAPLELDWRPLVAEVLEDLARGRDRASIAASVHAAFIAGIVAVARHVGERRVALSGGCFQNRVLAGGARAALSAAGYEVLTHRRVPPNDGGISLGQIAVAAARLA